MKGTTSFDVFDTVVTRNFAHPRDLFVHLGEQLRTAGVIQIAALAFARARWESELDARKLSPHVEVMLDDIYAILARRLSWDAAARAHAQELEMAIESRHLRLVPRMRGTLAVARQESGRLVYLSDMYLPPAVLRAWLVREGAVMNDDLLFVSGDARANKSSGKLFHHAQREIGGEFAHWRHAGDHAHADVASPQRLGITATHLAHAHLTPREKRARDSESEFALVWRSLLAGAMRLARLERAPANEREAVLWETGASVAGPLFYGFVRWTLAEAKRRGLRRLYFLARDGQIFWRLAQLIQTNEPEPIECRYLYGSRLVFAGPVELDAPDALRWLAAPTGHFHSIRQTLLQLGLDEAWARENLPARFAATDFEANFPQPEREALADWLLASERRALLREVLARRAADAAAYLESEGVRAGEHVGLVDAGWLGSIQRNLESILGGATSLTGFYLGLMPPAPPRPAGEMLGYANQFAPLPLLREESHKVLLELMAQSDHGQVIGFRRGGENWRPELNAPGPVNLDEIRQFQAAVLAFAARAQDTVLQAAAPEAEFARAVLGLYRDFHDAPTAAEARVFGFLPHADQLFEQRHATLCADFTLQELLAALRDFRQRPPHWWVGGQAALGHAWLLHAFRAAKKLSWRLRGRTE